MPSAENPDPLLDDPALADAIREGLITPAARRTGKPPRRKPILSFKVLMDDLEHDRKDR
jgi:hypothetical protein